jgi:hypothetical protein
MIHNKGGTDQPYQKFHVDDKLLSRLQTASPDGDGLLSTDLLSMNQKTTPPASSSSPGFEGQWAVDSNYLYFCMYPDHWCRLSLGGVVDTVLLTEDDKIYSFEDDSVWAVND